jgi:hypothetical protein
MQDATEPKHGGKLGKRHGRGPVTPRVVSVTEVKYPSPSMSIAGISTVSFSISFSISIPSIRIRRKSSFERRGTIATWPLRRMLRLRRLLFSNGHQESFSRKKEISP